MDPTDSPAPDASSFSDPSRFSPISVGDHAGYVYIAAILFAVYTTLSAIVRGHIKVNLFGYDDWTLFGSTVGSPATLALVQVLTRDRRSSMLRMS